MPKGDTPQHSREPRCVTCRHATIIQGYSIEQHSTRCSMFGRIPFPVYECSEYTHKNQLTLYQMEKLATIIEHKDNKIGFRKLTREERTDDF